LSTAPGAAIRLCALSDLRSDIARGLSITLAGRALEVLVLLRDGDVLVFENRCPHIGTPLNLVPDHFLDGAGEEVVCSTHGARFRLPDGHCVSGPCEGDALQRIQARVEGGGVWLEAETDVG
jgi:nitrite reductase/ring-hydroxylating ferredoxin subunit